MNIKSSVLAAVLALGAVGAQAAVYDFGVHAPLEVSSLVGGGSVAAGSILDFYTFEIAGSPQTVSSAAVAINLASLSISNGQYGIFSFGTNDTFESGAGDDTLIAGSPYSYSGLTGSTTNVVALPVGKYFYVVMGTAGASGGLYTLASTVTPVPEVQSALLMVAGLAAGGFVAMRRRNS